MKKGYRVYVRYIVKSTGVEKGKYFVNEEELDTWTEKTAEKFHSTFVNIY